MPAPYSIDLREKVLKFLEKNTDKHEASRVFNVGIATVHRWSALYKKKGHVKPKKRPYAFRRIDHEELIKFVNENPDAFLFEIADRFLVTPQAVFYACKKLKITRKKKPRST